MPLEELAKRITPRGGSNRRMRIHDEGAAHPRAGSVRLPRRLNRVTGQRKVPVESGGWCLLYRVALRIVAAAAGLRRQLSHPTSRWYFERNLLVSTASVLGDPAFAHRANLNAFARRRSPSQASHHDDESCRAHHPPKK